MAFFPLTFSFFELFPLNFERMGPLRGFRGPHGAFTRFSGGSGIQIYIELTDFILRYFDMIKEIIPEVPGAFQFNRFTANGAERWRNGRGNG